MGFAKLYGSLDIQKNYSLNFSPVLWLNGRMKSPTGLIDVNRRCKSAAKKVG